MQRRKPKIRRSGRPAFTLIELLVAMTMVIILAGALYEVLAGAFHAVNASDAALAPIRSAFVAFESVETDLENTQSPNANGVTEDWLGTTSGVMTAGSSLTGSSGSVSSIAGSTATVTTLSVFGNFEAVQSQDNRGHEADDVVFFTTTDSPLHFDGNGDTKQVELTIEPLNDGDNVLVRRVTRNLLSENQVDPDEEILCHHVSSFTLQYFDGAEWEPTWDSTQEDNDLPVAVEVVLVLENTDPQGRVSLSSFTRVFDLPCSTAAQDPNMPAASGGVL